MFDIRRIPIARILLPFAGGSLLVHRPEHMVSWPYLLLICGLIWLFMLILFFRRNRRSGNISIAFGGLAILIFMVLGYVTGLVTKPGDPLLPVNETVMIRGEVMGDPNLGNRNWVLEMRLYMLVSFDSSYICRTNLKVYMEMPSDSILPAMGETWQIFGQLSPIRNSGNPGEPDYEAIMHRKNHWYRFFADSGLKGSKKLDEQAGRRIRAARIRKSISEQWKGNPEVVSLLKAVCLGDRSGLTDDVLQSYATAGGMHLLAVSGLHVGLIWWVLHYAFGWMVRLLHKEVYRILTVVSLLWFYAFMTGFSSSVCRSVTMFSIFTLSGILNQRTHPVNSILVSAFVLILINPGRILDVGFQLSYAAIFGIVTLHGTIRSLLKVKNRILRWIWEATVVSLAAQLTTLPLVVYYFHQLPAYSIITNLVAIPLLSGLIALFVISVPLMALGVFAGLINSLMIFMGSIMNRSMEIIASIPGARIQDLQLDRISLLLIIAILFLSIHMVNYRITLSRYLVLFFLAILIIWSSWNRYRDLHTSELAIPHFGGCSLVTIRTGNQVDHYYRCVDSSGYSYMNQYIKSVWCRRNFDTRCFEISNYFQVLGNVSGCTPIAKGLWMVGNDQLRGWIITGFPGHDHLDLIAEKGGDFVLLSGEPSMLTLKDKNGLAKYKLIVDGSNRRWYTRQMELETELMFFTSQQGAYLKEW